MQHIVLMLGLALVLTSCGHHRDVRPGDNGINRVVVATDDNEEGTRDAISQANHYCDQTDRHAVFVKESQKYTGDMDESSYRNAKRATKVAKIMGGGVYAHGAKKESDLGGLVGLGGQAADSALGKGYTVDMQFKCK